MAQAQFAFRTPSGYDLDVYDVKKLMTLSIYLCKNYIILSSSKRFFFKETKPENYLCCFVALESEHLPASGPHFAKQMYKRILFFITKSWEDCAHFWAIPVCSKCSQQRSNSKRDLSDAKALSQHALCMSCMCTYSTYT